MKHWILSLIIPVVMISLTACTQEPAPGDQTSGKPQSESSQKVAVQNETQNNTSKVVLKTDEDVDKALNELDSALGETNPELDFVDLKDEDLGL